MTKTARQILTSLDRGEYLDKGGVDQALREIEAIMLEQVIGRDAGTTNRDSKPIPSNVYHRLVGANYAKERQRIRLQEALYGKED